MRTYLLPENGTFYKANLHCHSTISDGSLTPEEIKVQYMEEGYSIVAYTDHDIMIPHHELTDEHFLALEGYEMEINEDLGGLPGKFIRTCHLCFVSLVENPLQVCYHRTKHMPKCSQTSWHLAKFDDTLPDFERVYTPECINEMIRRGVEAGFFVSYNHPTWSKEGYHEYMAYEGMHAMEIVNYSSQSIGYNEYNPRVFDDMLRAGKPVFCSATDDNHNHGKRGTPSYDSFGGFNMIKATALTREAVGEALFAGNFYASEAPLIYELYVEDNEVHITTSPAREITLVTRTRAHRVAYATTDEQGNATPLTSATFKFSPDDGYFYIVVTDNNGRHANTQAYNPETLTLANR